MNEANLFPCWLYQDRQSKLSRIHVEVMPYAKIKSLPVEDLIAVLYYGRDGQAILALKELRRHFEDEMHHLESITYDQEPA